MEVTMAKEASRTTVDISFEQNIEKQVEQIARTLWCLGRRRGDDDHLGAVEFLAIQTRNGRRMSAR